MIRWLILLGALIPVLAIVGIVMFSAGYAPRARLSAESSADPACRAALIAGLEQVGRDQGLAALFTAPDADSLLGSGALEKTYARDGVRHTASLGLDRVDDGTCSLRLWAMKEETPGSTRSRAGAFGGALLSSCRCE
jgi:hypothetical protein